MLQTIVRKELREILRDRRLCAAAAVVPPMLAVLLAAGWYESRRYDARRTEAERAARRNWLEQGERNPHGAAHHGTYLFKPRPLLASFDPGLDPYLGTTVRIEAHHRHRLANRPAQDASDLLRFDASSAALVLQMVLPLVIILVGFSGLSRERERGTWPLLLSLGVPARTLILGKAAAVMVVVVALASPAAWFLLLTPLAAGGGGPGGEVAWRSGLLVFGYAVFLAGWVFLTLAVSARARSSRMALGVLVATWSAVTVVVPRLASDTARRSHPLPTQEEFDAWTDRVVRFGDGGESLLGRTRRELEARVLARYGVERKEDLPVNLEGLSLQASEELTDSIRETNHVKLGAIFDRQDRVVGRFAALSPFLAIRSASMTLAGTDRRHHETFDRAAERYRRELVRTMNEALAERPAHGESDRAGRPQWEKVPPFRDPSPGWGRAARDSAPALLSLSTWCALSAVLALGPRPRIDHAD